MEPENINPDQFIAKSITTSNTIDLDKLLNSFSISSENINDIKKAVKSFKKITSVSDLSSHFGGNDIDDPFGPTITGTHVDAETYFGATSMNDIIPICSEYNDSLEEEVYYIPVETSQGLIKIFLDKDPMGIVAPDYVQYDIFNSGKLLVHPSADKVINGVYPAFVKMINTYFFPNNSDNFKFTDYPSVAYSRLEVNVDDNAKVLVSVVKSHTNGEVFAYNICTDHLFSIINKDDSGNQIVFPSAKKSAQKNIKVIPICEYYSHHTNSDDDIISSHYNFANHLPGITSCSAPQRAGGSNTVSICPFNANNFTRCEMYKPLKSVISRVSVAPKNTTNSTVFELTHCLNIDKSNIFIIHNVTDNTTVNTLKYPSEISYENGLKEAYSILDSYLSCYIDHTSDTDNFPSNVENANTKVSFIQSLIEG